MKLITLSSLFYDKYKDCKEILQKDSRPYICLTIKVDDNLYAIPFRHNIKHKYCFLTIDNCGLDFSKTVIIYDDKFISNHEPIIDSKEFRIIKKNINKINFEFRKYIGQYKRAMKNRNNQRSINILKFSSLKYFEDYL